VLTSAADLVSCAADAGGRALIAASIANEEGDDPTLAKG